MRELNQLHCLLRARELPAGWNQTPSSDNLEQCSSFPSQNDSWETWQQPSHSTRQDIGVLLLRAHEHTCPMFLQGLLQASLTHPHQGNSVEQNMNVFTTFRCCLCIPREGNRDRNCLGPLQWWFYTVPFQLSNSCSATMFCHLL